jgi:hypothetical protein
MSEEKKINPTGIRSVFHYTATPVETCDHCSAAIKNVAVVTYKDETSVKLGCKCFENLLNGDTSLLKLYRKNSKLQKQYALWLEILNRPIDQMPRGIEYYDSGLYMIGDGSKCLFVGRLREGAVKVRGEYVNGTVADAPTTYLFHPSSDFNKNLAGKKYTLNGEAKRNMTDCGKSAWEPNTPENYVIQCNHNIDKSKEWLAFRLKEIEGFLARILAKGLVSHEEAKAK